LATLIIWQLATLLETINLALSSPPLSSPVLRASKAYLFLIPVSPTNPIREKIIGCVIAQSISTAMAIAYPAGSENAAGGLITVDPTTSLFAHPMPLPTPLGIPRMFVPRSHRRFGIATQLLSTAAATFIRGCPLDPTKGEVAFTQPTGTGAAVMKKWGGGTIRVYDEGQGRMRKKIDD
jgi:N-acetyltransferase